ncbi:uncharacterized protein LOC142176162 [Nicotiana tabacum]|uniref:Uncharacterized protein LOC142176162 n=1 Tax=Nicotiana tabacum TaxID=4097 RepID=A0AC58TQ60_TOBAC
MAIEKNSSPRGSDTTNLNIRLPEGFTASVVINQHHPLFLQPCDTPSSSLISIKLTGHENYALWNRSMRVSLLSKSKLGFVDGRYTKDKFPSSLHELWEKCNVIILSWIMNPVSNEFLSGMVYTSSAQKVWADLRESFDKGISSVLVYFSKLKELWAEFDALMPCPSCGREDSKRYAEHFGNHRLLQFLMGLNETYSQSSNQIMMMSPTPTINKAYAMIIAKESRISMANFAQTSAVNEGIAMFSGKRTPQASTRYKPKKNNLFCDYCNYEGHTTNICYKLHGYPADFKPKKKTGPNNACQYTRAHISIGSTNGGFEATANCAGHSQQSSLTSTS